MLHVTMHLENVIVNQRFQVTSVTNVLMDFMGFQTVEVGFSCQYFLNSYSYTKISINFNLQDATVIQMDLLVLNVMKKMESAPANQHTFLVTSAKNVLWDFLDFQTVEVGIFQ